MCPGYLVNLPEVIETARAWRHWGKGTVELFYGTQPNEQALVALEMYDAAINEMQRASMTPKSKGGIGEG